MGVGGVYYRTLGICATYTAFLPTLNLPDVSLIGPRYLASERSRIEDNNLLVVDENEDLPDGMVVVVLLNNGKEVAVKRLYREARDGKARTTER